MKCDLVLEGGGAKIGGLVGAIAAIEQAGFEPARLAGTSSGAITAALVAAGYSSDELKTIMDSLDFESFKDGASWGRKIPNLLMKRGVYEGKVFYETMKELLKAKGVETFGDLRDGEAISTSHQHRLRMFCTDLTQAKLVTWPDDAALYGLSPDHMEVAWALRTSMSIPYVFQPVRLSGSYFVDGGVLSNFPIWVFDSHSAPRHPTFGINLWEADSGLPHEITGSISYLEALVKASLEAHDKRFVRPGDFENRVIQVPIGNVRATDFGLSIQQKDKLYHAGYHAAKNFLGEWSWESYQSWAKEIRGIL